MVSVGLIRLNRQPGRAWLAVLLLCSGLAAAKEDGQAKAEARERFSHALSLIDQGKVNEALDEFQRAYELQKHPVVLYNIGHAYAQLGRAVEAYETLVRYQVESGESLSEEERRALDREIAAELARIGEVEVMAPEGATIRIDGRIMGRAPFASALRVAAGTHLVDASLPKHERAERVVVLSGGERARLELVPTPRPESVALGRFLLRSNVPGVEVFCDGTLAERLSDELYQAPVGHCALVVKRPGYLPYSQSLELTPDSVPTIQSKLLLSPSLAEPSWGKLMLRPFPADSRLTVDGFEVTTTATLPSGPHLLGVSRFGYRDATRSVLIVPSKTVTHEIRLAVEPAYAEEIRARRRTQQTLAYVLGGAGLLTASAFIGVYAWNDARSEAWKKDQHLLDQSWQNPPFASDLEARQADANHELGSIQRWEKVTVGLGVGATGLLISAAALYLLSPEVPQ